MKCKNCGGDILLENDTLVCQNCGSKFSVRDYCDDNDVYICYVESDANGRRTKDSAIAQEIYYILEEKKIKAFYKRISLEGYSGALAQSVDSVSLSVAKVVLLVATSKENYQSLWTENKEKISDKKIIPVYSGMNAYDIPKDINSLQALNYARVGASVDIVKSVQKVLGYKSDVENTYEDLNKKQGHKKIIIGIIAIVILLGIILAVILLINSKKDDSANIITQVEEPQNEVVDDENEYYTDAVSSIDDNKYADAIELLSKIGEYNDAKTLLNNCYIKYSGYYTDEATGILFRLQMLEGNTGNVELSRLDENGNKCTITESVIFDGCKAELSYMDSEGNSGDIEIQLVNEAINFKLLEKENKSEIHIPDCSVSFDISEKSDQPPKKEITMDYLEEILDGKTTVSDIQRQGFEISYDQDFMISVFEEQCYGGGKIYRFDNTDIYVMAFEFDITDTDNFFSNIIDIESADTLAEPIIGIVSGPASVLIPDKIGETTVPFVEGDYLFYPESTVYALEKLELIPDASVENGIIDDSTIVNVVSKDTVGETRYNEMLSEYLGTGDKETTDEMNSESVKLEAGTYSTSLSNPYTKNCYINGDTLVYEGSLQKDTGENFDDISLQLKISPDVYYYGYVWDDDECDVVMRYMSKSDFDYIFEGGNMGFDIVIDNNGVVIGMGLIS